MYCLLYTGENVFQKVIKSVLFFFSSFIVCHVALLSVLNLFFLNNPPSPPPSPKPLPMDIFLKIPTDWISYTKPFLKELRDKYTSTWELTQPLLDILIRITYIEYMIDHQANPKQDELNSLPTKVSCYFFTIIISHCKSEITTVSRKVF